MAKIIEIDIDGNETGRTGSSFSALRTIDHRKMLGDGAEDALHMVERELYDPYDFFGYDPLLD
jgi:hypothetical protein